MMTIQAEDHDAPAHTVVVLQTHYLDRSLVRRFRRLVAGLPGYDSCILMHRPPGDPKPAALQGLPHHFVTTPEIRDPAYPRKSGGPGWGIWRGGHTDLIALHFFRAHPGYQRYWFLEYDVRFSGAWPDFFRQFEESEADFLSTSVRRGSDDPDWMHWQTLRPPDTAALPPLHERVCSFMPIVRVSQRGLRTIDAAYRAGWTGHCEASWATILNIAGCAIEDFGGDGPFVRPGNRNRFYTNTPADKDLAPGSLVFRPVRFLPGLARNRLWHPVKPLPFKLREDARHLWVMVKPYLPWLRHPHPAAAPEAHPAGAGGWPEGASADLSRRSW